MTEENTDALKEVLDKAYTIANKLGTNDLKEALRIIQERKKREEEEELLNADAEQLKKKIRALFPSSDELVAEARQLFEQIQNDETKMLEVCADLVVTKKFLEKYGSWKHIV